MINRVCISINNRCNLACQYCHFREKNVLESTEMNVFEILDNIKNYTRGTFKIGFVGNGESFLDWSKLKAYIEYLEDCDNIDIYTITNGTVTLLDADWLFLESHNVNVGFSVDGYKELHDKYRCGSFDEVMENVENYHRITGHYPTFNATVGRESLNNQRRVIDFFKRFGTRVTFSRMIGSLGISLNEYHDFLTLAEKDLSVRRGGNDCTMYGGRCGAGINNFFFANGNVYLCGNCFDLPPIGPSCMSFFELERLSLTFDRDNCYKETVYENRIVRDADSGKDIYSETN